NVILDPGHGGSDLGARYHGVIESEIVLKISKMVRDQLKYHDEIKVLLTREGNQFLTLEARADFAHAQKGDLFLSIHCNSSSDSRARGTEIYFQNQLPPDEESLFLAHLESHG